MGKASQFPPDLWNLVDDTIVKPIPYVTEGTFKDPQGSHLHWTLTRDQQKIWAKAVGGEGHLNLYPAGPRATWIDSALRASANHTGFYPTMTVTLDEHGKVVKVEGGGKDGDLFRMLVTNPKMANAKYPSTVEPGYWVLSQDGFATNPKFVRDVDLLDRGSQQFTNLAERNRAGVQHFSFTQPGASSGDPRDEAYAKAQGLPFKHTSHMHLYFGTFRWRLSDTGEWITVCDKGFISAFNNAEIRALAAKYGDPDLVLRYEWIPDIPGINVPGNYQRDYGNDPWAWIIKQWGKVQNGTYEYYVDDYALGTALTSK